MHLVPCPECGRRVSSMAAACPSCGHPTMGGMTAQGHRVKTIEKTGKRFKFQQAVCLLGMIASCAAMIWGAADTAAHLTYLLLGIVGMFFTVCWWILIRLWIWWHHA